MLMDCAIFTVWVEMPEKGVGGMALEWTLTGGLSGPVTAICHCHLMSQLTIDPTLSVDACALIIEIVWFTEILAQHTTVLVS